MSLIRWDGTIWVRRTPDGGFPFDPLTDPFSAGSASELQQQRVGREPAPIDVVTTGVEYIGTLPVGEARLPAPKRAFVSSGESAPCAGNPHWRDVDLNCDEAAFGMESPAWYSWRAVDQHDWGGEGTPMTARPWGQ